MRIGPSSLAELAVVIALLRPGPFIMGMAGTYAARKHGHRPSTPLHYLIAGDFVDTLELPLFQESLTACLSRLSAFDLRTAEQFRRLATRRDPDAIETAKFTRAVSVNQGVSEAVAQSALDVLQPWIDYSFSQAHALSRATFAIVAMHLKRRYPAAFFNALLSVWDDVPSRQTLYEAEAEHCGLRPTFSIDESASQVFAIRYIDGVHT